MSTLKTTQILNFQNCSSVHSTCIFLCRNVIFNTTQHRTVLMIFSPNSHHCTHAACPHLLTICPWATQWHAHFTALQWVQKLQSQCQHQAKVSNFSPTAEEEGGNWKLSVKVWTTWKNTTCGLWSTHHFSHLLQNYALLLGMLNGNRKTGNRF